MTIQTTNTTDASRGQRLRMRVETRKHELETAVARLAADDASRANLENVLSQVEGLLTGDLDNFPHVVATELNTWLEASKHLDEHAAAALPATGRGFVADLDHLTVTNEEFRRVLYTAGHCQLVLMSLKPGEAIGEEVHDVDQFFRIEQGIGEAILDGVRTAISDGSAVIVPAGTRHNLINTGPESMKIYTIYSPPHHRDGVVHHTRDDAEKDDEEYDGTTTDARR
jgi:mannose-6-phosphate isomerase-like protein (cupin superfamily)